MPRITRRTSVLEESMAADGHAAPIDPPKGTAVESTMSTGASETTLSHEQVAHHEGATKPGSTSATASTSTTTPRGRGRGPGRPRGSTAARGQSRGRPRGSGSQRGRGRAKVTIVPTIPQKSTDTEESVTGHIQDKDLPLQARESVTEAQTKSSDSGSSSDSDSSSSSGSSSDSESGSDSGSNNSDDDDNGQSTVVTFSAEERAMFNSPTSLFLEPNAFDKYSIFGTGRMAEQFFEGNTPSQTQNSTTKAPTTSVSATPRTRGEHTLQSSSSQSSSSKQFTITDLVASVNSYGPALSSALDQLQAKPIQQPEVATNPRTLKKQQSQRLLPLGPEVFYHHPCIFSHQHRSALTKEEHRRFNMYESILRTPAKHGKMPPMTPEDHALWTRLKSVVEAERAEVRKWNASIVRQRLCSYLHPMIPAALEPKFVRERRRIQEHYPRYYDFLNTVGLRLPGVPAGTHKEPVLSRMKLEPPILASKAMPNSRTTSGILRNRGLMCRRGRICQVSMAKPTWPTDENGVPFEKDIDINPLYWRVSGDDAQPQEYTNANGDHHKDARQRGDFPLKRLAGPLSKDPLAHQYAEENRVHIALAASTMVTLAKVLPNLSSEWEIPVTVVMEEDEN
ncbi:hypothetical protein BGZ94_006461, partial [Podila epigama]